MKNLILIILLTASVNCFAQHADTKGLKIAARGNKAVHSLKVSRSATFNVTHYAIAKNWMANYFKQPRNITIIEDKAKGIICGNAVLIVRDDKLKTYRFRANLQIDLKANEYQIRFYDLLLLRGAQSFTEIELVAHPKTKTLSTQTARVLLENMGKEVRAAMEDFKKTMGDK